MSRKKTLSAVFDCMVYLQASISDVGPAAELLRHAERGNILIFINREILQELREVISRPKAVAKYPYLTPEFVEAFLERISRNAKVVKTPPLYFSYSRDPKDEKYVNAAIEVKADYLVSRDNDLLDLMTDHTDQAKEFRQRFRHLRVVEPVEFLRIIRKMDLEHKP